jgi:hypothetical protein
MSRSLWDTAVGRWGADGPPKWLRPFQIVSGAMICLSIAVIGLVAALPKEVRPPSVTTKAIVETPVWQPGPVRARAEGAVCPALSDAVVLNALKAAGDFESIRQRGLGMRCMHFDLSSRLIVISSAASADGYMLVNVDNGVGVEEGWVHQDYLGNE